MYKYLCVWVVCFWGSVSSCANVCVNENAIRFKRIYGSENATDVLLSDNNLWQRVFFLNGCKCQKLKMSQSSCRGIVSMKFPPPFLSFHDMYAIAGFFTRIFIKTRQNDIYCWDAYIVAEYTAIFAAAIERCIDQCPVMPSRMCLSFCIVSLLNHYASFATIRTPNAQEHNLHMLIITFTLKSCSELYIYKYTCDSQWIGANIMRWQSIGYLIFCVQLFKYLSQMQTLYTQQLIINWQWTIWRPNRHKWNGSVHLWIVSSLLDFQKHPPCPMMR